jgi:hypothetical protein
MEFEFTVIDRKCPYCNLSKKDCDVAKKRGLVACCMDCYHQSNFMYYQIASLVDKFVHTTQANIELSNMFLEKKFKSGEWFTDKCPNCGISKFICELDSSVWCCDSCDHEGCIIPEKLILLLRTLGEYAEADTALSEVFLQRI